MPNSYIDSLLATFDPEYQKKPFSMVPMGGEFQPQEVQAPMKPMKTPDLMAPPNLDVKTPEPSPLEAESTQPMQPMVKDYLAKKFDLGEFSDENRKKLQEEQSGYDLRGNTAAALAALGAAFQGGNSIQAANSVLDRNAAADQRKLDQFDKGRQNLIANYDLDRKVTDNSRKDDLFARENALDSQETALAQSLAKKMAPEIDFSGLTAQQINEKIPSLKAVYDIEQRKLDRQDAREERRALFGLKREEKEDARQLKADERELKLAVPGFERTGEVLPKEEEAMKFRKATAVSDQLSQKLNRMRDLVKEKGSFEWGGEAGQEMESLATEIQLLGKSPELYELGVLTGPDLSLLQKITSDPSSLSSLFTRDSTRQKQIDSQIQSIQNKIGSTAKSLGYQQKGGSTQPQTKVIGGVTYRKVPGGWEAED